MHDRMHDRMRDRTSDRLRTIEDRGGWVHARLSWRGDELDRLVVGEPGAWTIVGGVTRAHPLFGEAHPIWIVGGDAPPQRRPGEDEGEPATVMGAVRWAAPTTIPPIFAPARLPAGAGSMILNVLATLARRAGVERLRYAGPYPTAALWRTLAGSFRVVTPGADEEAFTAGALERAVRGDLSAIPIDLAPAPFERVRVSARVTVHLRDGVERATIDGAGYDRSSRSCRLVEVDGAADREIEAEADGEAGREADGGAAVAAELWLGDRPWGRAAVLDAAGRVLAGPSTLPAVGGELAGLVGRALPAELKAALATVIAELVAPPLAPGVAPVLAETSIRWGDPGAAEVRREGEALVLHAGLWAHLAPRGLAAVAR
ncbi:MAG TPA: hypothetical protein VHE35_01230, partial [Kofleriaceae bacterium]|nr:hypothetical protein [Kofleriaceae bacterium]